MSVSISIPWHRNAKLSRVIHPRFEHRGLTVMWLMPSIVAALTTLSFSISAAASVTVYSNASEWQAAVDDYSTITFTELPAFTWIDEQYSYLGIHFTDGSDQISVNDGYVDGQGLNGAFDSSTLEFDSPLTSIACLFPGTITTPATVVLTFECYAAA
jgi:hypothetical protein